MTDQELSPERPKRKRGAQPGNTNSLKHGFYARGLRVGEIGCIDDASEMSLLGEIRLLRVFLQRLAVAARDEASLEIIATSLNAAGVASTRLAGLLRTHKILAGDQDSGVHQAISTALAQVMQELKLS